MKKKVLIIGLSLLGIVLILAGTLFFLARSERGHQLVVQKSLAAMEEALEAEIEIGRASGNLLGRLVWDQVRLVREDLELEIDSLSFRVDYLALGDSHIRLTGLKAQGPRLRFKKALAKAETKAAPPGTIRESDLGAGETPSSDPTPKPDAPAQESQSTPSPEVTEAPEQEDTPEPSQTGEPAAAEAEKTNWRFSLEGASLEGGSVQGLDQATGLAYLGDLKDLAGKFRVGFEEDLSIHGDLEGVAGLDGRPVLIAAQGGFENSLVQADGLKIRFGPDQRSSLDLAGSFDPSDLIGKASYQGRVEPLDLNTLLASILPQDLDLDLLEGRLDLQGEASYEDNSVNLTLKGGWDPAGFDLTASFDPRTLELESSGRINHLDPARLSRISGAELPSGKTGFRFDLKGTLPDNLNLELDLDETDLKDLARARKGRLTAGWEKGVLTAKAALTGLAGFKAGVDALEVEGSLDSGVVKAGISFKNASGYKAKVESGRADVVWNGLALAISNLELTNDGGSLGGRIRADFNQGRIISGLADLNLVGLKPPMGTIWDLLGLYLPLVDLSSVRLTGPLKANWPGEEVEINFPGMKLESQWGRISGPGSIKLDARGGLKEYALDLDVTRFAVPGWLWSFLPVEVKNAVINGRLKVKGDPHRAVFEANLDGTGLGGREIRRFRLAGQQSPKGVLLKNLDLAFLDQRIKAKGTAWPSLNLKADIRGNRPQQVLGFLGKMGLEFAHPPFAVAEYIFKGALRGDPLKPAVKGRLALTGPVWEDNRADSLALDLDLAQVSLGQPRLPLGKVKAVLKKARQGEGPPLDLDLTAESSAKGIGGRLALNRAGVKAKSGWSLETRPDNGLGLSLEDLKLTYPKGKKSETWRSLRPVRIDLAKGALKGAQIALAGPGSQVLELDLALDQDALSGKGRLKGLDLGSWAAALDLPNLDKGRLSADLELSGSLESPVASLKGRVVGLTFLGKPAGDLDWTFDLAGGRLAASVKGEEQGREFLRGTARMDLQAGPDFPAFAPDPASLGADLEINGLDLAAWAAALKDERINAGQLKKGRLFASLSFKGPLEDLQAQVTSRVEGLVMLDQRVGDLFLKADLKEGRIIGRAEIEDRGESLLRAEGGLLLLPDKKTGLFKPDWHSIRADVDIQDLDLARFGPAIQRVEGLAGKINAKVNLAPKPKGWISLEGLEFRVAATGQSLEKGRIKLGLDRTRVSIEECLAETGGGILKGDGWLDLSKDIPFHLQADLSKARLLLGPLGWAHIKARVEFTQSYSAPLITGRVKLDELRFREPQSAPEESDEIILVDEEVAGKKPPAPPERLKMALDLDLGKKTPIQGEGLKAKVRGLLKILKEPGRNLRVLGDAEFPEGLYARFGRRFIIQRGKVTFRGLEKPDPAIDIAATTRVNSVDIDLGIGGTITKPDYILSSRPVMDRDDILAYLIFGQSASGSSETDSSGNEARTIGILGGPATELVKGIVSERLAPDIMTVSASNKGGVALEAGKQLLPNLFFSYVAYSEPTKPNEFRIEYRFSPNVAVESSLGDPETTGVDINFKYDF